MSVDPLYLAAHVMKLSDIRGTIPISPFLYVEKPDVAPRRPKTVWGTDKDVWLRASVTPYIGSGKPPMLFIYADGDDLWRREQNDRLKAELMAHGNKVSLERIADRTHGSVNSKMGEDHDAGMMKIAALVESPDLARYNSCLSPVGSRLGHYDVTALIGGGRDDGALAEEIPRPSSL